MTFDIHQPVFDPEFGEYDEDAGIQYQDTLASLFAEAPEGQELVDQGLMGNWTSIFLDYAITHVGVTPPKMTLRDVEEVLFEIFPRKVSTPPESAAHIITEMRAFWTYLGRAYGLANAPAIVKRLDDEAIRRLKRLLADPSMYGMAKSFVMMGMARGFDMTTEAGNQAWMQTYNSELPMPPLPGLDGGLPGPLRLPRATSTPPRKPIDKKRRQMAKASRKQNRRR